MRLVDGQEERESSVSTEGSDLDFTSDENDQEEEEQRK